MHCRPRSRAVCLNNRHGLSPACHDFQCFSLNDYPPRDSSQPIVLRQMPKNALLAFGRAVIGIPLALF